MKAWNHDRSIRAGRHKRGPRPIGAKAFEHLFVRCRGALRQVTLRHELATERRWLYRDRLSGRRLLTGYVRGRRRSILYREEGLSSEAIKHKHIPGFRYLSYGI